MNATAITPGTQYPFSISDIGVAAAQLLGDGWTSDSWPWGVGAYVEHREHGSFSFGIDNEGDVGVRLDNLKPHPAPRYYGGSSIDGLDAAADWLADAIRQLIAAAA